MNEVLNKCKLCGGEEEHEEACMILKIIIEVEDFLEDIKSDLVSRIEKLVGGPI